MKRYLTIIIILSAVIVTGLTSCLKDNEVILDVSKSPSVVEWSTSTSDIPISPSGSTYALYQRSYPVAESIDVPLTVNLTGSGTAPVDVVLTLGVKADAVAQYVQERHDRDATDVELEVLPSRLYEIPASVTIPKGQNKATVIVKLKTASFTDDDFNTSLILPVSITNTTYGNLSGNYSTVLYQLGVKNKYDGNYTVTATAPMVDVTSSSLTGYYPLNSDLVTVTANSVVMYCYTYLNGYQGHPIRSGGTGSSYYGNFAPIFHMDDAGNVTSVTNFWGQGTNANGRSAILDPSGVNKFTISADGTTRTLEVSYIMVQGGSNRTFFYEKWDFVNDR